MDFSRPRVDLLAIVLLDTCLLDVILSLFSSAFVRAIPKIFMDVDVEELKKRDPKGIYQAAEEGKIQHVTGMSADAPYEEPLHAGERSLSLPDLLGTMCGSGACVAFVAAKCRREPKPFQVLVG